MTKPNLTEIIAILDESGSMLPLREESRSGINRFIEDQKQVSGEARLTLVLFNTYRRFIYSNQDIQTTESLADSNYDPNNMTALQDAIAKTVLEVGERLSKTPEHERPSKVIVAILTDGLENASHEYAGEQGTKRVREMIEHQKSRYNWEFFFLGANMDAIAEATKLGIDAQHSYSWASTPQGTGQAYTTMTGAVTTSRTQSNP